MGTVLRRVHVRGFWVGERVIVFLTLTLFPHAPTIVGRGVVCLQLAPPRPPGTDLKVGTESRRHREGIPSSWCHELRVIHTN